MTYLLFLFGLALLVVGADLLIRGAAGLADRLRIPPLIIGLTVVAMGTSSPEIAVSAEAALVGQADLAIGNVVGSNNINVLLILGASALIAPLAVSQRLVRRDVPILIAASLLLHVLGLDGAIGRIDAAILLVGFVSYLAFLFIESRALKETKDATVPGASVHWSLDVGLGVVGILLLAYGSSWMVESAVEIAQSLGVSQLVIGLTVVALGTSLPELVTSLAATVRGERDIAVGNVIGSNIFNILLVLGVSGAVSPAGIDVSPAALTFDIPVMIAVSIACLPIFFTGYAIHRWEGGVFLGYYVAYVAFLFLDATRHEALPVFVGIMALFVVPITVLTLIILAGGELGLEEDQAP